MYGPYGANIWRTLRHGSFSKFAYSRFCDDFMIRPAFMIGLGEVLWDILPTGRVLGGAPANFAYMTNVLGDQGIVASRVGSDDLGLEAMPG